MLSVSPPRSARVAAVPPLEAGCAVEAASHLEQHALVAELAKAARYVRALLPDPQAGPIDADWVFLPSAELGGDAFGYHWLDADHFAVYLLDVCGHGINGALHSVSVLNMLRSQALRHADYYAPSSVLAALNEAFQMKRYDNMYFTIWYGVFDRRTRLLTYATGGHPPALLVTDREGAPAVERLRTRGLLVGGVEGIDYPSATYRLPVGSSLYVFSDGVYEVRQRDGTMMDLDDFEVLLTEHLAVGEGDVHTLMNHINTIRDCPTCMDDSALLRITFN